MKQTEQRLSKATYIGKDKHLCIRRRQANSFPLHAHDYFEIEIVLDGKGWQQINGRQFPLERGTVSVLSPSDFHEIHLDGTAVVWNIAFDEVLLTHGWLEAIFSEDQKCRLLTAGELRKVDTASSLLLDEYQSDGCMKPLMEYLLTTIFRSRCPREELSPIRKAILYTETHFRESPSLADAAAVACLSPVYFGNLFKKVTGETYVNYLNARKVSCAKMLLESGLSVTETCFASGFGSLSGFLHAFRKNTGLSPEEYKIQTDKNGRK